MVLCFSAGEKARKVLEIAYLLSVGGQAVDWYTISTSDLRVLGDLECIINVQS